MNRTTARRPLDWLSGQGIFQDLTLQADRLAELQALLDACAPVKGLGLRVKSLDQAVLSIYAPNASIAAKFRQFEPTILRAITERGWQVNRIRVRPQLGADEARRSQPVRTQKPTVPASAQHAMAELLKNGAQGSLAIAIAHFLKNRQPRG